MKYYEIENAGHWGICMMSEETADHLRKLGIKLKIKEASWYEPETDDTEYDTGAMLKLLLGIGVLASAYILINTFF